MVERKLACETWRWYDDNSVLRAVMIRLGESVPATVLIAGRDKVAGTPVNSFDVVNVCRTHFQKRSPVMDRWLYLPREMEIAPSLFLYEGVYGVGNDFLLPTYDFTWLVLHFRG